MVIRAKGLRGTCRRRHEVAAPTLENSVLPVHPKALLALADGTVFTGISIGASGQTTGEVVFNTSITGYQEILTDPSYCRQIVTLTYPHIGNTGINHEDVEAGRVHAAGLIIKDLPLLASNFRSEETLSDYLRRENTVAIADLDTRALTRRLRTHGAQNGCIVALEPGQDITEAHRAAAIVAAQNGLQCPLGFQQFRVRRVVGKSLQVLGVMPLLVCNQNQGHHRR